MAYNNSGTLGRCLISFREVLRASPLADRGFLLLSIGQLASSVGDYCYAVALPWLVLSTRGGVLLLGTVLACYGVPRVLCIPIGGILADKFGSGTVMLIADLGRCVLVAVLAIFAMRRFDNLAMIGPVAAVIGAGEGFFLPGSFSIIPRILTPEKLQAGNALYSAIVEAGSVLGPVIGGILVASSGSALAFAVDAASFAISAAALGLMIVLRSSDPAAETAAGRGDEGEPAAAPEPDEPLTLWQMIRRSRVLQLILLVAIVLNLAFGGTFQVALPVLAHGKYGATGYGALVACFGVGAVLGSVAAIKSNGIRRPALLVCCILLVEALAISAVPFADSIVTTAVPILVFGACSTGSNIILITVMQKWAPGQLLGRIMGLVMLASIGSYPASVAIAGVLVRHLGTGPFFPAAGVILAVTVMFALTQRELRDLGMSAEATTDPSADTESIRSSEATR